VRNTCAPGSGHRLDALGGFHDQRERRKLALRVARRAQRAVDFLGCWVAQFRLMIWNMENLFAADTPDGPPTEAALPPSWTGSLR
jgi:hypothetical protein